jgi:chemotaxis signal transduction protein
MGLAMVPLEYAFMSDQGKILELKPELLVAISENRELFSESIREIPKEAERIQAQLDRTVWNGNLLNSGQQATTGSFGRKVLLWEISSSGNKTRKVFEKSIGQLMGKAVSSILNSAAAHSALAVDIMDRNLYERANDCRWWSLAKVFREVFERGSLSEQEISECNRVLSYINGLYTVYTNLFLFDVNGRIVAVSNPSEKHQLGKILSDDYIRACLSNGDSQSYSVSPFVSTDLYGGRPTYIYASSIISEPDGEGVSKVLGGIGIVFDSEPQFRAMLQDSLPKGSKGQIKTGHIALFVNTQRQVISCSDSSFSPGQILDLPIHLEDIKHGESKTELCEIKGEHFAVGVTLSHGYREYKGESDSYKNDIYGIVMSSLGKAVALAKSSNQETRVRLDYGPKPAGLVSREFATFTIAGAWLGVDKEKVVECIDLGSITPVPGMPKAVMGTLLYKGDPVFVIEAYDLLSGSEAKAISDRGDQVVILKISGELVGLRVDDLGEIPEVPESYIVSAGQWSGVNSQAVQALVKPAPNDPLKRILVILNLEKFLELTIGNQKIETVRAPLSGEVMEISENQTGSLKSTG